MCLCAYTEESTTKWQRKEVLKSRYIPKNAKQRAKKPRGTGSLRLDLSNRKPSVIVGQRWLAFTYLGVNILVAIVALHGNGLAGKTVNHNWIN